MFRRISCAVLLSATLMFGQSAPVDNLPLSVDGVISMCHAGLSDDIVIAKIHQTNTPLNLSTDDLIRLKKANVSDAVVKALLTPQSAVAPTTTIVVQSPGLARLTNDNPSGATTAPGQSAVGDPNDPLAVHDSGIYIFATSGDGSRHMTMLERTGSTLAVNTGFGTLKTKAVLPGKSASIRTSTKAVFYFYFEDKAAGLGSSPLLFGGISNPNQFVLVKLNVQKSSRETVTGHFNGWSGSGGTDQKGAIAFKSEKIRPGLYRIQLPDGTKAGEYCFISSGNGTFGPGTPINLFDFGID
ncbi:MAG: hypothetical protein P4L10_05980 [Acidobacteriaceae bacterium]|nr:hypothetical protein [Acidobacteriaceae bacterium]